MATRRNITHEKTPHVTPLSPAPGPSNISPAVPTSVILKLLGFTLAMVCLPIGMYFVTVRTVFSGNSTYAGATAALTANAVLVGYVIVALREDQSDRLEDERRAKKGT